MGNQNPLKHVMRRNSPEKRVTADNSDEKKVRSKHQDSLTAWLHGKIKTRAHIWYMAKIIAWGGEQWPPIPIDNARDDDDQSTFLNCA